MNSTNTRFKIDTGAAVTAIPDNIYTRVELESLKSFITGKNNSGNGKCN